MEPEFEYDVAFSFLAADEQIAIQINDALKGSLKTFLYSERQKELAGTDGEVTFNSVFKEKSRAVVILYREKWGTTPWTRIEETAIRNRGFEKGYDFALLVPLDKAATMPKWFPTNRLWIGFERLGIKVAAGVIEARVQQLGGTPHIETLEERAARHDREANFQTERASALNSNYGVNAFLEGIEKLRNAIQRGVDRINEGRKLYRLTYRGMPHPSGPCAVTGLRNALMIQGRAAYTNTLENAKAEAVIWKNGLPWPGAMSFDEPEKHRTLNLELDYVPTKNYVWRVAGGHGTFSPEELSEEILKWYFDNGGDPAL